MTLKNLFIYLSGSINKGANNGLVKGYWTEEHMEVLSKTLKTGGWNAVFLNPGSPLRSDNMSDELSLFGRDLLQVYLSDLVIADVRERRGIGIGYEMAFANFKGIPVVSWAPMGTHYRLSQTEVLGRAMTNWTNPFMSQPSHQVIDNLEQITTAIETAPFGCKTKLTQSDYVMEAICHYLTTQFPTDTEMKTIVQGDLRLQKEIQDIMASFGCSKTCHCTFEETTTTATTTTATATTATAMAGST